MKTCPYCAQVNREGVFFCEECGHPFVGNQDGLATHLIRDEQTGTSPMRMTWGTARFDRTSSIVIRIKGHDEAVNVSPKDEILVGRSDAKAEGNPDLDMAPYGAAEHGVSRQHACIRRGEDTLTLVDLGSTNGTHLNGQRLIPHQPRVLRDGDEVRMGRLTFYIYFK